VKQAADLENDERWSLLYEKAQEARALQAFELFRQKGIEPVLIKGWAAGRFYPKERARLSVVRETSRA